MCLLLRRQSRLLPVYYTARYRRPKVSLNYLLMAYSVICYYLFFRFQGICSYLFWPIALIIGVEIADCQQVAKFIGIKIFTTEILAFQELGDATRAGLISVSKPAVTFTFSTTALFC